MAIDQLSLDTIIEVIRISDGNIQKKDMSLRDWKAFKKQPNVQYIAYQKGFSQFKTEEEARSKE